MSQYDEAYVRTAPWKKAENPQETASSAGRCEFVCVGVGMETLQDNIWI
mgnify:CR=1 FL=1